MIHGNPENTLTLEQWKKKFKRYPLQKTKNSYLK